MSEPALKKAKVCKNLLSLFEAQKDVPAVPEAFFPDSEQEAEKPEPPAEAEGEPEPAAEPKAKAKAKATAKAKAEAKAKAKAEAKAKAKAEAEAKAKAKAEAKAKAKAAKETKSKKKGPLARVQRPTVRARAPSPARSRRAQRSQRTLGSPRFQLPRSFASGLVLWSLTCRSPSLQLLLQGPRSCVTRGRRDTSKNTFTSSRPRCKSFGRTKAWPGPTKRSW